MQPLTVAYCHCSDCRRLSGAPVAAFAAFKAETVTISPTPRHADTVTNGVDRWFCDGCGAALAAAYDYLPDQVYVPIGLWDQAADLAPKSHSHAASALPWHVVEDDLPQHTGSGRQTLRKATP